MTIKVDMQINTYTLNIFSKYFFKVAFEKDEAKKIHKEAFVGKILYRRHQFEKNRPLLFLKLCNFSFIVRCWHNGNQLREGDMDWSTLDKVANILVIIHSSNIDKKYSDKLKFPSK